MKRIIILTGSELRHDFFRKFIGLSEGIEVIKSYCEGLEKSLRVTTEQDDSNNIYRLQHLSAREASEQEFFGLFVEKSSDYSNPVSLPKGDINNEQHTQEIIKANPDLLIAYGCSIIREPLLSAFKGRFINVHLGLSPYYRGSGTNYWPLVNNEPEYVGATYMHINAGIDTGEVIHQIRARCCWGDTPSQIGNRLIIDMSKVYAKLIVNYDQLESMPQIPVPKNEKLYKQKDYTEESVAMLYQNFNDQIIDRYLSEQSSRCEQVPIIENSVLAD